MRRTRFVGFLLWLVLAFAMAQQASLLHGLGHAVDGSAQKHSKPANVPCADCGLLASLTGAPTGGLPPVPTLEGEVGAVPLPAAGASARPIAFFRSRAPPVQAG